MAQSKHEEPGLFGQPQGSSSRDYTKAESCGKNMFNSSFPVSLVAYMDKIEIKPVYICIDKACNVAHKQIAVQDLLGIGPKSKDIYYDYEASFPNYNVLYTGAREKIDLVVNKKSNVITPLTALEVKLTALPDNVTKDKQNGEQGCEMVVRPPTILFLACSICSCYAKPKDKERLRSILGIVPQINHWEEADEVSPIFSKIKEAVLAVAADMVAKQKPLIIQPIWKTKGSQLSLSDDCLDCFVWSDLALLKMCAAQAADSGKISRFMRTIVWVYKMLFDYCVYGQFDYVRIIKLHSYDYANDKAFAVNGIVTNSYLKKEILKKPRIKKKDISKIILGGGQNLLSPERRFDAAIVADPSIFER